MVKNKIKIDWKISIIKLDFMKKLRKSTGDISSAVCDSSDESLKRENY